MIHGIAVDVMISVNDEVDFFRLNTTKHFYKNFSLNRLKEQKEIKIDSFFLLN